MPPKSPFSFSFVTCWRLKFGCRERHAFGWAANAGLSPLNASGSQWKCDKFCHGFWYIVCFKTLGLEGTGEIQCHKYHLDDKHNQTWDFWCVLERTTWSWVLQIYLFSIAKALVPDIWRRRTRAAQFDCKQSTAFGQCAIQTLGISFRGLRLEQEVPTAAIHWYPRHSHAVNTFHWISWVQMQIGMHLPPPFVAGW